LLYPAELRGRMESVYQVRLIARQKKAPGRRLGVGCAMGEVADVPGSVL